MQNWGLSVQAHRQPLIDLPGVWAAEGLAARVKAIGSRLQMMDFALKMMDFALKMMAFVLKMMDFVFKMMDFVHKMDLRPGLRLAARFSTRRLAGCRIRHFECTKHGFEYKTRDCEWRQFCIFPSFQATRCGGVKSHCRGG